MNEAKKKRMAAMRAERIGYVSIAALGAKKSQVTGNC